MAFVKATQQGFASVQDALNWVKQKLIDAGWTDRSTANYTMLESASVVSLPSGPAKVYLELRKDTVSGVDVLNAYFWENPNKTGNSHGFGLPVTSAILSETFYLYANEFWFCMKSSSTYLQYPTLAGAYYPAVSDVAYFPLRPWFRFSARDVTSNSINRTNERFYYNSTGYSFFNRGPGWNSSADNDVICLFFNPFALPYYITTSGASVACVMLEPILFEYPNTFSAVGKLRYGGVSSSNNNLAVGDTYQRGNEIYEVFALDYGNAKLWVRIQ